MEINLIMLPIRRGLFNRLEGWNILDTISGERVATLEIDKDGLFSLRVEENGVFDRSKYYISTFRRFLTREAALGVLSKAIEHCMRKESE